MNALPCTSQALAHASPHLCHIGCDSDRRLHRLIHQHQRWPVHMPSIMATSKALVMASSAPYCPCSDSGRRRQVPGIHFIWIGTVRIMMINIANPPVCFVLGIRIAELIHWSFPRGFGERVRQNTEFISGSTGHWAESCLLCKIILLIAACLINPDFVSHKSSVKLFFLVSRVLGFDCEMQSVVSHSQAWQEGRIFAWAFSL